jgi:hypothetical protein
MHKSIFCIDGDSAVDSMYIVTILLFDSLAVSKNYFYSMSIISKSLHEIESAITLVIHISRFDS